MAAAIVSAIFWRYAAVARFLHSALFEMKPHSTSVAGIVGDFSTAKRARFTPRSFERVE